MRRISLIPLFTLLLAAQSPASVARLKRDVEALAAPSFGGRGNGEEGLEKAANLVSARLKQAGLHSKVQRWDLPLAPRVARAEAKLISGDSDVPLERGKDYEVMGWSGTDGHGPKALVVLGAGLMLPAFQDAAPAEVKGQVVVIPRRVAEAAAPGTTALERSLSQRIKRLEGLKVAAVLVLEEGAPSPLRKEEGPASFGIPVLSLRQGLISQLRPGTEEARRVAAGKPFAKSLSSYPWLALALDLELQPQSAALPNLLAEIRGRDPKLRRERLLVGAHMDHLGHGTRHSLGGEAAKGQVHPGADDNASGTALVLELARRFKQKPLRRSATFAFFSGEEEGLLGSRAYLQDPDAKTHRFMANFDMVGRLDPAAPRLFLGAYGAPAALLDRAKALAPKGWTVTGDLGASVGGSDHMSFAAEKIPTFFFFTGLHTDYHRPTDTADKVEAKGLALLADYAEKVLRDLDAAPALPGFDASTAVAPKAASPLRVTLGVIPDYGTDARGFRLSGVSKGGAAEAAGLRAGDVITRIAGKEVKDIHGYMAVLSDLKAGEAVEVRWIREGRELQAMVAPAGK